MDPLEIMKWFWTTSIALFPASLLFFTARRTTRRELDLRAWILIVPWLPGVAWCVRYWLAAGRGGAEASHRAAALEGAALITSAAFLVLYMLVAGFESLRLTSGWLFALTCLSWLLSSFAFLVTLISI